MSQHYSNPTRESDPHALPDVETFKGYRHECLSCGHEQPLFPDYYGLLYPDTAECVECSDHGMRCVDTKVAWYWWTCLPGCLPDSDPIGPFSTEAEALADAQEGSES